MTGRPKLSVLDLAIVGEGSSHAEALPTRSSSRRSVERLGYHRHWVAEHHNMPGIASSSPAVLAAALAATTERIRIGSGGVMLPNHAPLVVAEQFGMLEALHPGRIDLGIGRAPGHRRDHRRGPAPLGRAALRRRLPAPAVGADRLLPGRVPRAATPTATSTPCPASATCRRSGCSAPRATRRSSPGCSGCRSRSPTTSCRATPTPALELYREHFRPSEHLDRAATRWSPCAALAADDDERAR